VFYKGDQQKKYEHIKAAVRFVFEILLPSGIDTKYEQNFV
jgi:Uma2 family endonuclease